MKVSIPLNDLQVKYVTTKQLEYTYSVMYQRLLTDPENQKQYKYLIKCLKRLLSYYQGASNES